MLKSRKLLPVIIGLFILILFVLGSREIYYYYNPNVIISYRVEEFEDFYLSLPSYAIETRSHFGYSSKYNEEMKQWWVATNEIEVWLRTDFIKPIYVSSDIDIVEGKTIITYSGTGGLPDGGIVPVYRRVELDFIASKEIP